MQFNKLQKFDIGNTKDHQWVKRKEEDPKATLKLFKLVTFKGVE